MGFLATEESYGGFEEALEAESHSRLSDTLIETNDELLDPSETGTAGVD